jgi:hypothetical protein
LRHPDHAGRHGRGGRQDRCSPVYSVSPGVISKRWNVVAQFAGYVDLQRTAELADSPLPKSQQALRAVGMTYVQRGDQSTMHVRLVVG